MGKESIKSHEDFKARACIYSIGFSIIFGQYLSVEQGRELYGIYNQVLSGLVNMINNPNSWVIGK